MKEDVEKIASSGFDAYLIRPYDTSELFETLSRFLDVKTKNDLADGIESNGNPPAFEAFYSTPWECPPDLIRLLHQTYLPEWEEIKKKRRIPDIKAFSENIRELGNQHAIGALSVYGKALWTYADSIDVACIHKTLAAFPELLRCAIPLKP